MDPTINIYASEIYILLQSKDLRNCTTQRCTRDPPFVKSTIFQIFQLNTSPSMATDRKKERKLFLSHSFSVEATDHN